MANTKVEDNWVVAKTQAFVGKGEKVRLDGWATDEEAAEIRRKHLKLDSFRREVITDWRLDGYIRSIHLFGKIWLVNIDDVKTVPPKPKGNPILLEQGKRNRELGIKPKRHRSRSTRATGKATKNAK